MENKELLEEFKRCAENPIHFISKYIKVTHPVRGLVPFKLYPFQERILSELQDNRFNILRKFRQAGCTTIAAAYSLWMIIFQKHKSVVILSKGDAESTEVLDRIKLMYDELPEFLKPGIIEDNKHTLKLKTNSVIKSRPSGKQSGRSLAGSFLIIDEAAFIENIDTIWAAVYPIISTGGRAFVLSTVNGIGNWYHEVYQNSLAGTNSFNAIDIRWQEHPEYSFTEGFEDLYKEMKTKGLDIHKWEETTKANMPTKQWLQEYECSFLGTGDTYVEGEVLKNISSQTSEKYYTKYNNRMRVWQDPHPQYTYLIACDTSLGRNRDYSAFHVINLYNGQQVAEFYSNRTAINDFAKILFNEGMLYNVAAIVCERNTIGNNLIDWLLNIYEYENLWEDDKGDIGFQVTAKNRESILAELEEALRTDLIKINSTRTCDELMTFIISDQGKPQAEKNHHDDLVMSLALAVHSYKNLLDSTPVEFDTRLNKDEAPPLPPSKMYKHRFKTEFGGVAEEDYKWLTR
tara:strand:- start:6465 stop:8012 length:1548 start_codon:yes stop_codon:yes gene_type:complete